MRTGSKNPVLLCRAGLIYCKNNQAEKGVALLEQAVTMNPYMDEEMVKEAKGYLDQQGGKIAGR